ncbi:non-ribosomal peptide synthetase [Jidongwangia harbinensis]|uniref:non-ribosomal peptide synthetase n=1 Tax=Jidongwangia harbinensis TaxID=2878561 RepID=UPI001CDA4B6A|nr:non-ribosomal peptide synthetase [Jidongwangia harbinensis]MCA2217971.1 amino acid adenylation domain-containing protein [Jidongwangia harbinensis]
MLTDSQRAKLAARLRQGRTDPDANRIPRRRADLTEIPLSSGQEQLWFLDQLAPGRSTYTIAGAVTLAGALDTGALQRSLDALVARHESLRTRLVGVAGRPTQVIDPPAGCPLPVTDLTAVPTADREARWRELAREEAERPFALDRGPLLRARLLRVAADRHVLVVAVHHTVFDGWSFGVLLQELSSWYAAEVADRPADLPPPAVQFADYAVWERERLRGEALDELVGYWRDNLAGAPVLQLPTDRPRPLVQTYDGDSAGIDLDADLLDGLKALGRREGSTLFVTLMTAFQVLLHRYTGQDDIVVGTVSANRTRPELAPMIGYLVNTLPIRGDLSGDPGFAEALQRVRTATLGAYAHQDLSFARMVDALRVPRDPSRSPIFQVGFMLAEDQRHHLDTGGLTWTSEELAGSAAKFDLLVSAVESGGRLHVGVSYATALFDAATVGRLLGHFEVLLRGVVADPRRPLSRLPLMTATELRQELLTWNDTEAEYPAWCLHEKFEAQVAATPDAVAVELDGDRVTYAELNAQANRIARRLRELGVGRETLVGICTRRSVRRLAGLLGILKAGGGYVPLDPQYPADRLAFMVQDAHLPVVITDADGEPALPAVDATLVSLDRDWPALSELDGGNLDPVAEPADAAYVIYTSGSTGRPKGVVVEHRQAVNFATAEIEHWPLGVGDRVLQFASLNFDVSVLDMFGALLSGATLVLGSTETLLSPPRLADLIRRERITFMCLPPAVLNLLADEEFPSLRVVIAGGEAFTSALVRSWDRPGLRFINGYGPTETTVGATMAECHDDGIDPPPIGLPLANYTAYVLDRHLNPVPVGVPGELHLGGAGVTRGYLNRPELTAQKFITDPFSEKPGARLYKTGDVVRRLPDGNLQFLGRFDDQVKIRGLRVELGEIEAVLADHPAVAQAVVVVGTDAAGQKHLVGYARSEPGGPAVTVADLRAHLSARLPGYMVPAHLMVLATFPLNANGKVDRGALPEPGDADRASEYVAPRTVLETVVADLYATLLAIDRVGIDDDFFDLGGNSLQAMQLITRLRTDLAVDTDVTAIFLAPTPARLAVALRDRHGLVDADLDDVDLDEAEPAQPARTGAGDGNGPLVAMNDGPADRPLFLVHAIGGTVYGYAPLARELADAVRVYGIQADGAAADLDELVDRYVAAVRSVAPSGPYRLGGWSMGGLIALEMARRLTAGGEDVALLALLDSPLYPADLTVLSEDGLAAQFVADAARALGSGGPAAPPETATVPERLRWLAGRLSSDAGYADTAYAEIERRFAVFREQSRLIAGYRPAPVLASALVVGASQSDDLLDTWAALLGPRTRRLRVDGDHYSFLQAAGAGKIAAAVREHVG